MASPVPPHCLMVFDHHKKLGALVQGDTLEVPLESLEEKEKRCLNPWAPRREETVSGSPLALRGHLRPLLGEGGMREQKNEYVSGRVPGLQKLTARAEGSRRGQTPVTPSPQLNSTSHQEHNWGKRQVTLQGPQCAHGAVRPLVTACFSAT